MLKLVFKRGQTDERVYPLVGEMILGRSKENEIAILDTSLSRRHARIEVVSGGHTFVVDLGSSNGTFVNGARVDRRELFSGDVLRCGALSLHVVSDAPLRASEPEAPQPSVFKDLPNLTYAPLSELVRGSAPRPADGQPADPQLRLAHDRLVVLLKVSEMLSSPESSDRLLTKILDMVFEILDVSRGAVLLVDKDGQPEPRAVKSVARFDDDQTIWSRSIVRHVLESGKAGLFHDARVDPRVRDSSSVLLQSIRSSMCVPLRSKAKMLGVLYVDNLAKSNLFVEDDLDLLAAFANQAAIAIENATLYQRIETEAVLRNNLLRFFPPSATRKLTESHGAALEVIETEVTAVFADISNFTRMSAEMEPRRIVDLLNEYFPVVADVVFRHEGTLEKYIGDALLAIWGAPYSHPEDADRAVWAAVEMQRAVAVLNGELARKGKPTVAIHIGVNTGIVAAGNIGSEQYIQYAAIGDTTNVASRICSAAQEGEIFVSASTLVKMKDRSLPMTALPPVHVKGKDAPLQLYRVEWTARG